MGRTFFANGPHNLFAVCQPSRGCWDIKIFFHPCVTHFVLFTSRKRKERVNWISIQAPSCWNESGIRGTRVAGRQNVKPLKLKRRASYFIHRLSCLQTSIALHIALHQSEFLNVSIFFQRNVKTSQEWETALRSQNILLNSLFVFLSWQHS